MLSCRPNTGRSPFEEEKTDLLHKYNKISIKDAGESFYGQKIACTSTTGGRGGGGVELGSVCSVGSLSVILVFFLFWRGGRGREATDRLAQLVERRTTVREVSGSSPRRTNTQGLKNN